MARLTAVFVCQQCEYQNARWFGRCPNCGEWNTAVETAIEGKSKSIAQKTGKKPADFVNLSSITKKSTARISTKISELDRVLGGGLVTGQVILVAGEPGIGKSTILLQLADSLGDFLYVSGEESVNQIKIRADRLKIVSRKISLLEETDIDSVITAVESQSAILLKGIIIDSVQTMTTDDLSGMAGSVGQVREVTYRLVRLAKSRNIPVIIVGHVTKQGSVAGPAVLAHLVDTVLWFEGDQNTSFRLLRAMKNRFGPTDEVGIFSMQERGLVSVADPSGMFLSMDDSGVAGCTLACILKGTRPILVEIQALTVKSKFAYPKRVSQGFDLNRLEVIIAVLARRCGLDLSEHDCFINVAGGMSLKNDPSADLAVALALASSYKNKSLPKGSVAVGEVGLLGDIRKVNQEEKRVKEAIRLGYKKVIGSNENRFLKQVITRFF